MQRSILLGVSGLIMCFILVLLWLTIASVRERERETVRE